MDRNAWIKAVWQAQVTGLLTPARYFVARAMVRRASKAGVLWPSRATLASDVGCSERTVDRATADLRTLGLLDWQQRRLRWNQRDTNLYGLRVPALVRPRCGSTGGDIRSAKAKPLSKKDESILESSSAILSDGSLAPGQAEVLTRLGALIGCSPGEVMLWLPAPS